ncbi:MAG: putative metalloprotease CJM1_0395 family protein [Verrucomicrobiota bacterium]|nr:putative metalloprotease CJM1_0395 family protein [Verrucomicrobiota bacterium]
MIDSSTAEFTYTSFGFPKNDKTLSPAKEAEKARIEARLAVLEKKIDEKEGSGLGPVEKDQVERLKERDGDVRAHEMAHVAAAGFLAQGGMKLNYQTGPDGRQYAVGSSVKIDTSEARTPEETVQKAQRIRAAALALLDPSPQDLQVAAKASQMETRARAEIMAEKREAIETTDSRRSSIYSSIENSNSFV